MKTKADLLNRMRELVACAEATRYVTEHPSDRAVEIWTTCPKVDYEHEWDAVERVTEGNVTHAYLNEICAEPALEVES